MIMVVNRIAVAEGFGEQFEARFRNRAQLVDKRPGFVRWELQRPIKGDTYNVVTYWESVQDFEAWTSSPEFQQGHTHRTGDAPPKEMFRGKSVLEIHEVVREAAKEA